MKKRLFKETVQSEELVFQHDLEEKRQVWTRFESGGLHREKYYKDIEPEIEAAPLPKYTTNAAVRVLLAPLLKAVKDFDEHVGFSVESQSSNSYKDYVFKLIYHDSLSNDAQMTPFRRGDDCVLDMKFDTADADAKAQSAADDMRKKLAGLVDDRGRSKDPSTPEEIEREAGAAYKGIARFEATYKVENLVDVLTAAKPVGEVVTLSWTADMPLKVDVEMLHGKLVYWMAPVIGA